MEMDGMDGDGDDMDGDGWMHRCVYVHVCVCACVCVCVVLIGSVVCVWGGTCAYFEACCMDDSSISARRARFLSRTSHGRKTWGDDDG